VTKLLGLHVAKAARVPGCQIYRITC